MWTRITVALVLFVALLAAQPRTLQITSPSDGAVVPPGGTLRVSVKATQFAFQRVFIGGKLFGVSDYLTIPPYDFQVTVPTDTTPGPYLIGAIALPVGSNAEVVSDPTTIQVERPDTPETLDPQFPTLTFDHVGERCSLDVDGIFADGSRVDLTHSKDTKFVFASPSVAFWDGTGFVIARARGRTLLTITHRGRSATVQVTVKNNGAHDQD